MRLTLRQLLIFTAVADTGSTTAAGGRVSLSQSATSGALNELESLLGARLFDRIGKRLLLNDNGRALLPQARALLDGAQEIESQFGLGGAGSAATPWVTRLRVGASTTIGNYVLPALVAGYLKEWAGAAVDVVIGNTRDVAEAVTRLEVDLGLIEGPCPEAELRVAPWLDDELVIVAAPTHALVPDDARARVPLKALRQARWLLREPGSGTREAVEHVLLPHLHHLHGDMQPGSTEAIKQAAAEGLGLACLSLCAVQDLVTLGRLVVLPTTLPRLARRFYLIHHGQKRFSGNLRRFVAHCERLERWPPRHPTKKKRRIAPRWRGRHHRRHDRQRDTRVPPDRGAVESARARARRDGFGDLRFETISDFDGTPMNGKVNLSKTKHDACGSEALVITRVQDGKLVTIK